ncbi:MAG: DUF512 domain-containing protein [Clostridiales bacterium]|nr:DUF512 domain-containing protein [Clostridiales bacterium]
MEKEKKNVIIKVEQGSIAEEIGILPGEVLLRINGKAVEDVFDYRYLVQDDYLEIELVDTTGEEYIAEIEKDYDEDIGIVFESGLMDEAKHCSNRCIFCFIDQLPPNMRKTLYFKDDDSRLSFLQGNYVTLTNMKPKDIERIIYYHLSPINISVHTTDLELRKRMLKNPKADQVLKIMEQFAAAGIEMNLQIVLCRGINDGEKLDQTIGDLSSFYPHAKSLSVVPIGLTKYRAGLYPMEPFTKEDSEKIIDQVEQWQKRLKQNIGSSFVFISDEFYLKAQRQLPPAECYEDFPQIENGVGMISLLWEEFNEALKNAVPNQKEKVVSLATGKAAAPFIQILTKRLQEKFPNIKMNVYTIENKFFGPEITVSGLLTGQDIIEQLKEKELGSHLLLPRNLLRSGEHVLLDDVTVEEIEKRLAIPIKITDNTGRDFISQITED